MCKSKQSRNHRKCTELGDDPAKWSKESPLPPPNWFEEQLEHFECSVLHAAHGEVATAIKVPSLIRSDDLRDWYVEHGQVSGNVRNRLLGISQSKLDEFTKDKFRISEKLFRSVNERDKYCCRYCGLRLVDKRVLAAFGNVVGTEAFKDTGTNEQRHGVVLAFRANTDHVLPHRLGGQTNLNNLVTACWCCNYGKGKYTLEEIGIDDPRDRVTVQREWDGLISYLPMLYSRFRHRNTETS